MSLSKSIYPLLSTGSTQEDKKISGHYCKLKKKSKIVNQDVKHQQQAIYCWIIMVLPGNTVCILNILNNIFQCYQGQISIMSPTLNLFTRFLTLNAPITTKVVCFSRLLKCLRSLYGKQCGPRSDCSYRSSLFWVHAVCFYT